MAAETGFGESYGRHSPSGRSRKTFASERPFPDNANVDTFVIAGLIGCVSLLYATAGQAGGTAFLAVMAFADGRHDVGTGLIGLLVFVLIVLGIAALVKYLFSKRS